MKDVELLSPVGNIECLYAAVQNGADAVYLGTTAFNARMNSDNFGENGELKSAVDYAHIRNTLVYLTLNTLILEKEIKEALEIVEEAYSYGIDGIIVQDLGIAKLIRENFPDLPLHASTQMTVYSKEGVAELESLGFKRVVLARELSLNEIKDICQNTSLDIEVFVHGALCISYSGQCLASSMIGGRSANRGKCAGTCRLPYNDQKYLLSMKDLCSLDLIPDLIKAGVKSFKIEGRMKSPEYVATVTKIYRKYIDMAVGAESISARSDMESAPTKRRNKTR